jgi:hypothetical protein
MSGGSFIFQTNTCNPIPQNIAGTGTIIFNNLTVNNILGVTATGNFGVRRLLELQNGSLNSNGKLTLLSDAFSTAMLVNNAFAVIGVATVQRLVLPYGVRPAGLGYTYFSNPTDAATMGAALGDDMGIVTNPAYKFNCWLYPAPLSSAPFPNVYLYNESLVAVGNDPACNNENTDKFETAWVAANSASAFTAGKGFCINISGNTLTDITGTLNNGNINVPVTKTNPAAANSGYNLVGNPYPSPIDWDLLHSANAGLLAPQVMRRVATDTYAGTWAYYVAGVSGSGTNGADNKIATMQGFFVRALASGNMQFSNSVRLTSYDNSNFFRNEEKFSVIRLKAECKGKFDETSLYFGKNAENHGNAVKSQFNSAPFPNLFSLLDGKSLAVQGLAKAEEQTAVPVSLTAGSEGWHQLSISHIENMKNVGIFVENKKTGELHNLKIAPFSVYLKKGEKLQEHQIKFFENKNSENDLFTLLPNPASDLVQLVFNQAEEGEISFCDMSGRILLTQKVSGFSAKCDIGSFPKGLFIVKFVGKANSQSLKFVKE